MLLADRGPLVEREQDLAILEAALTDGVRGRPAVVVIEGSAGIGKTRLLAEGRRLAHDAGARVLIARASELEGELAFGVVRQLFEATLRADGPDAVISAAASASELLNAPPRAAAGSGARDTSFAMLHSLYWLTITLATDAPLVIAVDDLHWCDEPSLRFLNYLLRSELISTMQVEGVAPESAHVSAVAELGPRAVSRAVLVRLLDVSAPTAGAGGATRIYEVVVWGQPSGQLKPLCLFG